MTTPIVDFVKEYEESGASRFHMPGHKGKSRLGFEKCDITEIHGADVLYSPNGIIEESENNASRLFGTAHTFYSAEGSSLSVRAMLALASAGKKNATVLAALTSIIIIKLLHIRNNDSKLKFLYWRKSIS